MNPTVKNIVAFIAGIIVGNIVNMGIIMISSYVIPPPEGADVTTLEGLKASMHLFEPKNFLMPYLAHALGTFAGAAVATYIAANHTYYLALGVGFVFLLGGIANVIMLPSPLWFTLVDLLGAYFPAAYLGWKLAGGTR